MRRVGMAEWLPVASHVCCSFALHIIGQQHVHALACVLRQLSDRKGGGGGNKKLQYAIKRQRPPLPGSKSRRWMIVRHLHRQLRHPRQVAQLSCRYSC